MIAKFVGDSEVLPDRLKQLPDNETIASIAGDGACDTASCHQAITTKQAQALIPHDPVRSNGSIMKTINPSANRYRTSLI